MEQMLVPIPWQTYSDERNHYSYVRCLSLAMAYEVVRVTHDKHGDRAEFVHRIIFMNEYSESALSDILKGFGYDSLEAFVQDHAGLEGSEDLPFCPAGGVGHGDSPIQYPDYMLLASLMAEHFNGQDMTAKAADDLAQSIVGTEAGPANPFCIRRFFLSQPVLIPLSKTELTAIYQAKHEQVLMTLLRDALRDLADDDPCFDGRSKELLLQDAAFLKTLQGRWHRYNENSNALSENLREAITVTVHQLFPAADPGAER